MHDLLTTIARIDAIEHEITRLLQSVNTHIFILEQDAQIIKAKVLFKRLATLTTKQRDLLEILPARLHEVAQCQNQIEQLRAELQKYQEEIHSGAMGLMPQAIALGKTLHASLERINVDSNKSLQHLEEFYNQQRTWLHQYTYQDIEKHLDQYRDELLAAEAWSQNHVPMKQLATIEKVHSKEIKAIKAYKRKLMHIRQHLNEMAIILSSSDPLYSKMLHWQKQCEIQINNRTAFLQWVKQYEAKHQNPLLTSISHLPSAKKNVVISPRGAFAMMSYTPIPNIWFTENSIRINPFRDGHYRVGERDHGLSYSKQGNKFLTPVTTLFAALPQHSLEKPVSLSAVMDPNSPAFTKHLEELWREHFARQFAHKAILLLHLQRPLTRRDVELTIHLKGLECIKNLLVHLSQKKQTQLLRNILVVAHIMGHAAGFITYREHDKRFHASKYSQEISEARSYLLTQQLHFEDGHTEALLTHQELNVLLKAQNTANPREVHSSSLPTSSIEKIWSKLIFVR